MALNPANRAIGNRPQSKHWRGFQRCSGRTNKEQATAALLKALAGHRERIRTITFDNGTEFHDYKVLEQRFGIKCYFATPYHSWERGSNENLNGLVRQYLPKGMCMRSITQKDCNVIATELNERPRKRYAFQTPEELYCCS